MASKIAATTYFMRAPRNLSIEPAAAVSIGELPQLTMREIEAGAPLAGAGAKFDVRQNERPLRPPRHNF